MGYEEGLADRLTATYVKIRNARAAATRDYEEADRGFREKLEKIETVLLDMLNKNSPDLSKKSAISTAHGSVYREMDIKPSAESWEAVYEFIVENNAFEMLEKRLTKGFVKKYLEENDNAPPPGVRVLREYRAKVRAN